jgi:hypothetical protein
VAQVDPKDDSTSRFVLRWYRFDPERNERRHVSVAAYTQEWEFNQALRELSNDLEQRKSLGLSEDVEHVSGVLLERGYLERVRQNRLQGRLIRQRWTQHPPPPDAGKGQ